MKAKKRRYAVLTWEILDAFCAEAGYPFIILNDQTKKRGKKAHFNKYKASAANYDSLDCCLLLRLKGGDCAN